MNTVKSVSLEKELVEVLTVVFFGQRSTWLRACDGLGILGLLGGRLMTGATAL